ncbi:MAG: hypothetical protein HW421_2956 [Ignavibacteria bacterium]|nr:hypothetical protein [Ignavibacteria bacterium]
MVSGIQSLPITAIAGLDTVQTEIKKNKEEIPVQPVDKNLISNNVKLSAKNPARAESMAIIGNKTFTDKSQKSVTFKDLADSIKSFLGDENLTIEFSRDRETSKMIMKVVDNKTKEVVKQFPPEIAVKIARIVSNTLQNGQLTDAAV